MWKLTIAALNIRHFSQCSSDPGANKTVCYKDLCVQSWDTVGREWSHWHGINRNLLNLRAGAERSYLISLQTEALARSWLLGYLFENRHSDLGSVLDVCMCAPVSLESYPPPCFHVCIGSSVILHNNCCRWIDLWCLVVWWSVTPLRGTIVTNLTAVSLCVDKMLGSTKK